MTTTLFDKNGAVIYTHESNPKRCTYKGSCKFADRAVIELPQVYKVIVKARDGRTHVAKKK